MSRAIAYREYYIDRLREADLIADFPGDEILIDGLHAMQMYLWNNGVSLEIPIVRVMNTAHFLAAYMFATTCSGDQMEYDAIAHDSLSRDKQLTRVAIIVLAAMLARTEGFRARNCRNLILDNRDPDFDEGVTLYDRFLRSAEKRFAEEDFLIDTQQLISRINEQEEQISQLTSENIQLKYTITTMEEKYQQNNQYNNCVIYNAPVYNSSTTNNYYPQVKQDEDVEAECPAGTQKPVQEEKPAPETEYFPYLTKKCFEQKRVDAVEAEIQAARKGTAEDMWRTLWNNENMGYMEIEHINANTLYRAIEKWYGKLPYTERNFRGARNKRRVPSSSA